MTVESIDTIDLRLIPYRPADLLALIKGVVEFRSSFGLSAAEGLREFLLGPDVAADYVDMLLSSAKADVWRHGFAVVDRETQVVVGNAAFVGPPNADGEVEIAYAIAPSSDGRGFATQAARALTEFAFSDDRVRKVFAYTLPEKNASTRVLEKVGFSFAGQVEHPVDGTIWRWEKPRA
jgi:RimJ/RimL family protein N-acetyltransferase